MPSHFAILLPAVLRGRARSVICVSLLLAAACALPPSEAWGQREASNPANWPTYNRDLAGTRYSPLSQINTENVHLLREAWSLRLGRHWTTGSLTGGSEFTPIVIDGIMYL